MPAATRSAARSAQLAIGVTVWGAAIWASTQLHTIDLPIDFDICGPWGCAAAPAALLGYHALWASLLIPGVAMACRALAGPVGRRIALVCFSVGAVGLISLFGWGAADWMASAGSDYALQRGLFVVATSPDLPAGQLALAGIAGRVAAGSQHTKRSEATQGATPSHDR
ncbi:MAG: hypothetical protein AAGJ46_17385 [Planctomycetota bacterium]